MIQKAGRVELDTKKSIGAKCVEFTFNRLESWSQQSLLSSLLTVSNKNWEFSVMAKINLHVRIETQKMSEIYVDFKLVWWTGQKNKRVHVLVKHFVSCTDTLWKIMNSTEARVLNSERFKLKQDTFSFLF